MDVYKHSEEAAGSLLMAGESSSQEMETASFSKMLNGITPQKTNV
jgi:hypothetical protein